MTQEEWEKAIHSFVASMRSGIAKTNHITGRYFHFRPSFDRKPYACALGAAWVDDKNLSIYGLPESTDRGMVELFHQLESEHPIIHTVFWVRLAKYEEIRRINLATIIVSMNDHIGHTREYIASWVEGLANLPFDKLSTEENPLSTEIIIGNKAIAGVDPGVNLSL